MENRNIAEEYQEIAQRLINERKELEYIKNSNVQIICLRSDRAKKTGDMIVHGECEKVPAKYKWSVPCDFTITIYEPNIVEFSDKQVEILMFHELLHVGINEDCYYVKKHDLEDFKLIIDLYGTDWSAKEAE